MLTQYRLNKTKTKLPQQRPSTEIAATFSSCYHALSASSHLQPQVAHDLTTQSQTIICLERLTERQKEYVAQVTGNFVRSQIYQNSKIFATYLTVKPTSYYKMLIFLNKHVIFKLFKSYRTNHLRMTLAKLLATLLLLTPKFSLLLCTLNLHLDQKRWTSRKLYLTSYLKDQHTRQISYLWK